jgi:hypothetical protein
MEHIYSGECNTEAGAKRKQDIANKVHSDPDADAAEITLLGVSAMTMESGTFCLCVCSQINALTSR